MIVRMMIASLVLVSTLVVLTSAGGSSGVTRPGQHHHHHHLMMMAHHHHHRHHHSSLLSLSSSSSSFSLLHGIPRGGMVYECETSSEVESQLIKAGTSNQLVVIDFSAEWCGPCKMIAPIFKELSDTMAGSVVFLKVDVDVNQETAAKYSVSAMPTFLFIKRGEVVDTLQGANPARLRELIEEHM